MTTAERAKQFAPFDSEGSARGPTRPGRTHSRVQRHDISEEQMERNSEIFAQLTKGTVVDRMLPRLPRHCRNRHRDRDRYGFPVPEDGNRKVPVQRHLYNRNTRPAKMRLERR